MRFHRRPPRKLLRKLLARDSRRLLLQSEFRDAVAQRLELLLTGKSRLFRRAQAVGDFLLAASHLRQGLFSSDPRLETALKLGPQHLVIQFGQFDLELFKASVGAFYMLQSYFR